MDLSLQPLFYSAAAPLQTGVQVLQGSSLCLGVFAVLQADGGWLIDPPRSCYDVWVGDEHWQLDDCLVLDQLGEVSIEFEPVECGPPDALSELPTDRLRVRVVPPDGLRASLEWYTELQALRWLEVSEPVPPDLVPPWGEPLQLVPGVEVGFPIVVVDSRAERVAWDLSQGRVLAQAPGQPPRELSPIVDHDELWPMRVEPGQTQSITLELAGARLPVVEVVATPASAAASIEVVTGGPPDGTIAGARAVVRDEGGRVILGTPVEWRLLEGHLALGPLSDEFPVPPEYLAMADACDPPPSTPQPRRAVLEARLGDLVDRAVVEWIAEPEDEPGDEPFEAASQCQRGALDETEGEVSARGCRCRAGSPGAGGWPWLMAVGVGLARRRRRSPRTSA